MRNLLLVLFFTFSLSLIAQQNITLLAKLPYANKLSNVWGYVDETNVEYALLGVEDGLSIVSLANPANPIEIAKIPGTLNTWREIKTYGDYAYVSSESGDGLLIVDLSPLPSSNTLNYVYKSFNTATRAHTLAIDEKGFCYLFGTDRNQETVILDIKSSPMNPTEVGHTGLHYAHDGIISGDTMYLAHITEGFVGVYNIVDRANAQFLTSFNTPLKFTHNIALSSDKKYLYATDEKAGSFVAAYDISDFNNIFELDRFQRKPQNFSMVHNTHINNGYLVNSYYLEGVNIVDAHDPKNLVEVGFYDTTPNDSGYAFKGVWGVYPYFPSGTVVASDIQQGLFVFSALYNRACYVSGTVKDLLNNSVLYNVKVTLEQTDVLDYTDLSGTYRSGFGTAGSRTLHFTKAGYYDTTAQVTLGSGSNQTADVLMRKKPSVNAVFKVVDNNNLPVAAAKLCIESEDDVWRMSTQNNGVLDANIVGLNFKITIGKWMYVSTCDEKKNTDFTDTIVYVLQNGIYDDFSFDYLWSTIGDASKGEWVRDVPYGTFFNNDTINPNSDAAGDCNAYTYVTGNSKNPDFTFNKVDQVKTELRSPVLDFSTFIKPSLSFYLWFDDYDAWNFANDSAFIALQHNSEVIYLDTIVGSVYTPREKWNLMKYDLTNYNLNSTNYQFKISAVDVLPHNALELGLDVFQVQENASQKMEEIVESELVVFPNPCTDILYLKSNDPLIQYFLRDAQGKVVLQQKINIPSCTEIHVESLSSGFYFLEVINSNNERLTKGISLIRK